MLCSPNKTGRNCHPYFVHLPPQNPPLLREAGLAPCRLMLGLGNLKGDAIRPVSLVCDCALALGEGCKAPRYMLTPALVLLLTSVMENTIGRVVTPHCVFNTLCIQHAVYSTACSTLAVTYIDT